MELFKVAKDGGPDSNVTGYWLIECKKLFSIALLRFGKGSRENYHNHAFNAISWILKGELIEYTPFDATRDNIDILRPSIIPVYTSKERMHKIYCDKVTWAITFRGPWSDYWKEFNKKRNEYILLTHGRKVIAKV